MALASLCIGTGSQGRTLVDNPINTKASDFVLFIGLNASSESWDESVHFQKLDGAFDALKYRISTYFPDFFLSSEQWIFWQDCVTA